MSGHKITLGAVIAARAALRLSCGNCAHSTVIPAVPLARRHGPAIRLDQIERVGRCTACGSREVDCRPEYPPAAGVGGMAG